MSLMTLDCPECHEERLFEPPHDPASCPDRVDSPEGGCPELACAECGAALAVGFADPRCAHASQSHGPEQSPERAA
jgi:hypothetical protein